MKKIFNLRNAQRAGLLLLCAAPVFAQADPWSNMTTNLYTAFQGPIAKGLVGTAVVTTGLATAYSEGTGKKAIAALGFGGAMAMSVPTFMGWLFN